MAGDKETSCNLQFVFVSLNACSSLKSLYSKLGKNVIIPVARNKLSEKEFSQNTSQTL